jgi:hypothetical protein
MSNPCFISRLNLSLLEPKIGLELYVNWTQLLRARYLPLRSCKPRLRWQLRLATGISQTHIGNRVSNAVFRCGHDADPNLQSLILGHSLFL